MNAIPQQQQQQQQLITDSVRQSCRNFLSTAIVEIGVPQDQLGNRVTAMESLIYTGSNGQLIHYRTLLKQKVLEIKALVHARQQRQTPQQQQPPLQQQPPAPTPQPMNPDPGLTANLGQIPQTAFFKPETAPNIVSTFGSNPVLQILQRIFILLRATPESDPSHPRLKTSFFVKAQQANLDPSQVISTLESITLIAPHTVQASRMFIYQHQLQAQQVQQAQQAQQHAQQQAQHAQQAQAQHIMQIQQAQHLQAHQAQQVHQLQQAQAHALALVQAQQVQAPRGPHFPNVMQPPANSQQQPQQQQQQQQQLEAPPPNNQPIRASSQSLFEYNSPTLSGLPTSQPLFQQPAQVAATPDPITELLPSILGLFGLPQSVVDKMLVGVNAKSIRDVSAAEKSMLVDRTAVLIRFHRDWIRTLRAVANIMDTARFCEWGNRANIAHRTELISRLLHRQSPLLQVNKCILTAPDIGRLMVSDVELVISLEVEIMACGIASTHIPEIVTHSSIQYVFSRLRADYSTKHPDQALPERPLLLLTPASQEPGPGKRATTNGTPAPISATPHPIPEVPPLTKSSNAINKAPAAKKIKTAPSNKPSVDPEDEPILTSTPPTSNRRRGSRGGSLAKETRGGKVRKSGASKPVSAKPVATVVVKPEPPSVPVVKKPDNAANGTDASTKPPMRSSPTPEAKSASCSPEGGVPPPVERVAVYARDPPPGLPGGDHPWAGVASQLEYMSKVAPNHAVRQQMLHCALNPVLAARRMDDLLYLAGCSDRGGGACRDLVLDRAWTRKWTRPDH